MVPRLYKIDLDARRMLTLSGQAVSSVQPTAWTLRDTMVLGWTVYRRIANVETPLNLTGAAEFRLMLKPSSNLQGDAYASAIPATWNQTTDWADADITAGKICCRLSLAGETLIALYSAATDSVDLLGEIEIRDGDDYAFTLARFGVRIFQDVVQGGEAVPSLAPAQQWKEVVIDDVPRLAWLFPDANWYALIPRIVDGQPTHSWTLYEEPA